MRQSAVRAIAVGCFLSVTLCSGSVFAQSSSNGRAGLLGSNFFQGQSIWLSTNELADLGFNSHRRDGVSITMNAPAFWSPKLPAGLGQDLYASMITDSADGSNPTDRIEGDFRDVSVGVITYFELTPGIRPFIQTGVERQRVDFTVARSGVPPVVLNETGLGVSYSPGLEVDLAEQLAWRSIADFNSVDPGDETRYRSEMIYRINESLFLRGGVTGYMGGYAVGGIVGGGVSW